MRIFSDLHKFNFRTSQWDLIQDFIQEPKLRFGHTAVKIGSSMIIFGGWDGIATQNDLWDYNFQT